MAVWGQLESYFNTGSANTTTRDMAAAIIGAFDYAANGGVGPWVRVASNYGRLDVSNGATGFDPATGGAAPIGHDGFIVYKLKPTGSRVYSIYMLIQWGTGTYTFGSRSTTIGSVPRVDPAKWVGNTGTPNAIGISFACALTSGGADANPWTGTTNNNGLDTKGTVLGTGPIWAAPGGGSLYVYPRSNNTGGSHATNKENLGSIIEVGNVIGAGVARMHIVGDDENLIIAIDASDDNSYTILRLTDLTLGVGLAHPIHHMVHQCPSGPVVSATYASGTTTGNSLQESSIVGWDGSAYRMFNDIMTFDAGFLTTTFQPSNQHTSQRYDTIPDASHCVNEATFYGFVGREKGFAPIVFNTSMHEVSSDHNYMFIGTTNALNTFKFAMPWDGGSLVPKSGITQTGTRFRR